MDTEIKTFRLTDFEVKGDGDAMTIEGYGSTFGGAPDSYRDIMAPGCFAVSLRERTPKMLYQHRRDQIAGVWEQAYEDTKGLFLRGRFIDTTIGRNAYIEAKEGAIDSMSIGYSTVKYSYDETTDVRTLEEVKLFEVSLVTFPANGNALITTVKSAPDTLRAFEEFLREAGFSRKDATTIALRGFKALGDPREAEDLQAYTDFFKTFTTN